MTERHWEEVRARLGLPYGWKLAPKEHDGFWTLTASDPAAHRGLRCGHRTAQVRAVTLPLAVARMFSRIQFHQLDCR